MSAYLLNEEVIAAFVNTLGLIIATIIGSFAGVKIKRNRAKEQKLEDGLRVALLDLRFLLDAENRYCSKLPGGDKTNKIATREAVHKEYGYRFSGDYTKSSIAKKLRELT